VKKYFFDFFEALLIHFSPLQVKTMHYLFGAQTSKDIEEVVLISP